MNRKSPLRTALLFLLKLGVSAGMLAWIFSRIPVRGVWDTLLSAHAGLLLTLYFYYLFAQALNLDLSFAAVA